MIGGRSNEQYDKKNGNLKEGLTKKVSPHDWVYNEFLSTLRFSVHESVGRRFSSQSKSGESIHDHVNPQHLNSSERSFSKDSSTREHNEHSNNVDSKLELKEFTHVVIDVSSVQNGNKD